MCLLFYQDSALPERYTLLYSALSYAFSFSPPACSYQSTFCTSCILSLSSRAWPWHESIFVHHSDHLKHMIVMISFIMLRARRRLCTAVSVVTTSCCPRSLSCSAYRPVEVSGTTVHGRQAWYHDKHVCVHHISLMILVQMDTLLHVDTRGYILGYTLFNMSI